MRRNRKVHVPGKVAILTLLLVIAGGCGRDSTTLKSDAGEAERKQPDVAAQAKRAPEQKPERKPEPRQQRAADDPAAQLAALRDAVVARRWREVAAAIPRSWRSLLAKRAEIWGATNPAARSRFLNALAGSAELIAEKSEFIAASKALVIEGPAAGLLKRHLKDLAEVASAVARSLTAQDSQGQERERLIQALVKTVAADPELVAALEALRFETISRKPDAAAVRYRSGKDASWRALSLEHFEGRWVPRTLLDHWRRAEQSLKESKPLEPAALSDRLRQITRRLEEFQKRLADVETQEEFDSLIRKAGRRILQARRPAGAARRDVAEDEFAWLVVKGELLPRQKDRLLWNVARRTDAPASAIADMRSLESEGRVRIRVGPVADVQAFAERLTGLTIEDINEEKRTITARIDHDRSP